MRKKWATLLVSGLDPSLVTAVNALHRQLGWVPSTQLVDWPFLDRRRRCLWIVVMEGTEARASARIELHYSRRRLATILRVPRGPVAMSIESLTACLEKIAAIGLSDADDAYIRPFLPPLVRPRCPAAMPALGFCPIPDVDAHSDTLVLDVARPLEEILTGFRDSTRRQLNSAARKGLKCHTASSDQELQDLVAGYNRNALGKSLPLLDGNAMDRLARMRDPVCGRSVLLSVGARVGARLAGAAFFTLVGRRMTYEWGFADRTIKPNAPITHSCFWHAIQAVHGSGIATFDLGGYWSDRGADDPINRFKLGFSDQVDHLGAEYRYSAQRTFRWRAAIPGTVPKVPSH